MTTFTIGDAPLTEERYEVLPIKERALRQIKARIMNEDWTFKTVRVGRVQRIPVLDREVPSGQGIIGIIDGLESFGRNTQTEENEVHILFQLLCHVADDEEPSTVINIFMTEVLSYLYGQHDLEEPDGTQTGLRFAPISFTPQYGEWSKGLAIYGELEMSLRYRTRAYRPAELF